MTYLTCFACNLRRWIVCGALLCTLPAFSFASGLGRPSSAEVLVGVATSTGWGVYEDAEGDRVAPGSVGTTLLFSGYLPFGKAFAFSPNFSLLTTDGKVTQDPIPPTAFDIRFHQREIGADLLVSPGKLRRLQVGVGTSLAWWTATEDNVRQNEFGEYERGRSIDGKALLGRGIVHLALRNPEVSGAALKLIAAWPLAELLRLENTAATGYIGLQCGFSMLLN